MDNGQTSDITHLSYEALCEVGSSIIHRERNLWRRRI